ncbi:hypothetical protein J6590_045426 [Homalodisca vitripennis]|nr:hypothetical protein J6590_045426 [Homalodisca vitripennis]
MPNASQSNGLIRMSNYSGSTVKYESMRCVEWLVTLTFIPWCCGAHGTDHTGHWVATEPQSIRRHAAPRRTTCRCC